MTDQKDLIGELQAWSIETADFHSDRQLSDKCLLATGWSVERGDTFEGGIRWFFGVNPQVSASETTRPHLIHDLGCAIGARPFRWSINVRIDRDWTYAEVYPPDGEIGSRVHIGKHQHEPIAVLIAAISAWEAHTLALESRRA